MNKSYRNVFCLKTGTYVAAPETAASRGKKSSRAVIAAAVVAVIGAMLPLSEAGAQTTITAAVANSGTIVPIGSTITQTTTNPKVTGWGALAAGNAAVANGNGATALGNGAQAIGDKALAMGVGASATKGSSIAIGTNAQSNETLTVAVGANAITTAGGGTALGSNTTAGYLGTALGYGSTTGTTSSSVALGYASVADRDNSVSVGSSSTKRQIINVAAGTLGNDAVNVNQLKGITTALGGGAGLDASGNVIAPGYTLTTPTGGTTTASNVGDALKQLDGRVAGNTTNVTNLLNGTAGLVQQASNTAAITVGKATGGTSVSFANSTGATRTLSGVTAGSATTDAVNVGQLNAVQAQIGSNSASPYFKATGKSDASDAAKALGTLSVAAGAGAVANSANSTALGASSVAMGANAISVGNGAAAGQNATNTNDIAIGNKAKAANMANNTNTGVAIGATALGDNATAYGVGWAVSENGNRRTDGLGLNMNAAANQGGAAQVAVGAYANAGSASGTALGSRSTSEGPGAVAVGNYATTNGRSAIAMGTASSATANEAMVLGSFSVATQARANAIGQAATASAADANAIGTSASATGNRAIALGSAKTATAVGTAETRQNTTDNTQASGVDSIAIGTDSRATATNAIALGTSARATNTNSVALGSGSVTSRDNTVSVGSSTQQRQIVNVAAGTATTDAVNVGQLTNAGVLDGNGNAKNVVTYDSGTKDVLTLTGPNGTTIKNVNAGALNATSKDAVNGAQLYATNQNVAGNTTNVTNLLNGTAGLVQQASDTAAITVGKSSGGTSVSFANKSGATRTLSGVTAGQAGTDAVNVNQLNAVQAQITTGGGGGAASPYFKADGANNGSDSAQATAGTKGVAAGASANAIGNLSVAVGATAIANSANATALGANSLASGTGSTALGNGAKATAANSVALGVDSTTTANLVTANYNPGSTALAGTASAANGEVSMGSAGKERRVTNIAAGAAATDAVNVSQLQSESAKSNAQGVATATALGGGATYNSTTGVITAPSYTLTNTAGNKVTSDNVGDALTQLDGRVAGNTTNVTNVLNGKAGLVQQASDTAAITVGKDSNGTSVSFANKAGTARTLSDVAAGKTSTDAVNVGQLSAAGVLDNSGNAKNVVTYDSGTKDVLTLAGTNGTTIKNVNPGALNATSKEAVNGAQLYATNQNVAGNTTNITNLLNGTAGLVQQASSTAAITVGKDTGGTSVSFNNSGGATRTLSGVTAGTATTDAVNVGQLDALKSTITSSASPYFKADGANDGSDPAATRPGTNGVASGAYANATGNQSVAVGAGAIANTGNTTALGANSLASNASATAVGNGAQATNANSVALGAGSTTNRDNIVSVGSNVQQRQITNLAAGTQATDAVNVGQLTTAGVLDGNGNAKNVVTYDSGTKDVLTLAGTNGTTIKNVNPGALNATSKEAVNGSQLYATNQNVAGNTGDIDNLKNGKAGLVQQADATSAITVGKDTGGTSVTFANGKGDARTLNGVAKGAVNSNSTDAINGSQLFDASTSVASALGGGAGVDANGKVIAPSYTLGSVDGKSDVTVKNVGDALGNLDSRVINNSRYFKADGLNDGSDDAVASARGVAIGAGAVATQRFSVALGYNSVADAANTVSVGSADNTRRITHVGDAFDPTDAVNLQTLRSLQTTTVSALTGNINEAVTQMDAQLTTERNARSFLGQQVAEVSQQAAQATQQATEATQRVAEAAVLTTQVAADGSDALVQQDGTGKTITVAKGADGTVVDFTNSSGAVRKLTGIDAGTSEHDAVNVGQLTRAGVLDDKGNAMDVLSYDMNSSKGTLTLGGQGGTQIKNVADGTDEQDAVNVRQLKSAGLVNAAGQTMNAVTYNDDAKGQIVFGGANGTVLSNVAAGRDANDAANVGQLRDVTSALGGGATVDADGKVVAPTYTVNNARYSNVNDALQSLATNIATVQQAPAVVQKVETTTTNSAFASNGDQANVATATGSNAVAIGAGASASAANSVAIGAGSVADRANTVSVGSVGNERAIANVADAVADTDAVNKRQLDAVQSSNQAYTDARADQLQNDIASVKRDANGAAASAMAVAGLPQSITPGASMASVAASTMDGESAIAVGVSKVSDNARWITKISGTVNSRGKAGATVGIGFQF